ncbi:MAG: hypothetical protein COB66_08225 [Coxiella sp. (in: Bacteria)]|nr:MAG: hypothetical protein COB66_08225 [Coxiella sp. (in: g-proteobacteria)]
MKKSIRIELKRMCRDHINNSPPTPATALLAQPEAMSAPDSFEEKVEFVQAYAEVARELLSDKMMIKKPVVFVVLSLVLWVAYGISISPLEQTGAQKNGTHTVNDTPKHDPTYLVAVIVAQLLLCFIACIASPVKNVPSATLKESVAASLRRNSDESLESLRKYLGQISHPGRAHSPEEGIGVEISAAYDALSSAGGPFHNLVQATAPRCDSPSPIE